MLFPYGWGAKKDQGTGFLCFAHLKNEANAKKGKRGRGKGRKLGV